MRTNRFQGFTTPIRTSSLRRLKTVLSPSSHHAPSSSTSSAAAYPASSASTDTTSPLSLPRSGNSSHEDITSLSPATSVGDSPSSAMSSSPKMGGLRVRAMKRRPSILVLEMEEEKKTYGAELKIMEPRPNIGLAVGGIFEVLEGRV